MPSGFLAQHPKGLSTLFFTEMWERFSYYGMRAFLILYMTAPAAAGGLGFDDARAGSIYGVYTGSVWAAAIVGGLIADRFLGQYKSVLVGGIIIALGHFVLAFDLLTAFYVGLGLIVVGTGLLKPSVSTLVGALYPQGDARRDAGFSIFYMGINLGAFMGPLIAGYLAQRVDWHLGFGVAGVGMTLGLIQYVIGRDRLKEAELAVRHPRDAAGAPIVAAALTSSDYKRLGAVVVFFVFASIFWGAYEQAGSTLNLFADRHTQLSVGSFSFPSSWFQSVQPLFVIILAPIFAWFWTRLGDRQPSTPAKFAYGLLFVGLAFVLLVPAGALAEGGVRVSPMWLIGAYFIMELGEMCISPVGLSAVTKLAPTQLVGLTMGIWFLATSAGSILAGWAATYFSTLPLTTLFGISAGVTLAAALILTAGLKPVRALMAGRS
ncbi:MAG TPA: peptide MFS transporter [Vicinamibacterales bacterium]|nr:peptide MFS transporter [Vicinamibacterales bacterium]